MNADLPTMTLFMEIVKGGVLMAVAILGYGFTGFLAESNVLLMSNKMT